MPLSYESISDGCPYDAVSGSLAVCPRFAPRAVFDRLDDGVSTCAHVRCSIASVRDDRTIGGFYLRCVLKTSEVEVEPTYTVPLD